MPSNSRLPIATGLGNLPSHWLATAFLIGTLARGKLLAAIWATLGLGLAVAVYYTAISLAGDRPDADLSSAARAWLLVAVAAGPLFGTAGATWLTGPRSYRPFAVGLLCGVFAGEAVYLVAAHGSLSSFSLGDTPTAFGAIELVIALALPFLMLRDGPSRLTALATGAVCALLTYVAIVLVIEGVRDLLSPR